MAWDRIRGHDAVRRQFLAARDNGRFGQAYLFAGPDGVGKRLFARELTKALLCGRPPAALTGCDACPSCAQVEAGTHPDAFRVGKVEGRHELLSEDMKAFCVRLALRSAHGGRKVGVVEDADDLNLTSANNFLKPLEEPPPGTVLILLSSAADQLLPTILSRCQLVRFAPLDDATLRAVLTDHGVADAARVDALLPLAGGSVGRALALNDDAVWAFRERLTDGLTAPRPNVMGLMGEWSRFVEDAGKETAAQRLRLSLTLRFLVEMLRRALRLSLGADAAGDERLRAFAERAGSDRVLELIERVVEADGYVDRRVPPALVVESVADAFARAAPPAKVGR